MQSVLIISTQPDDVRKIRSAFSEEYRVDSTPDIDNALSILAHHRYELLFVDLKLIEGHLDGDDFNFTLKMFQKQSPSLETIIMTAAEHIRRAISFVKLGASDYITYPISCDEIHLVIETIAKSVMRQSELDYLRDQFWKADAREVIQTKSPAMVQLFNKIRSVAATKTTVLLTGETGTGKSVLAKLIHQHSNRQKSQFISVHCGAIPDTLLESELFGHEKGAFTGALRKKLGKFEIANGGTIFLDEIGTLTPQAQIKLLQVLQDGTFSRVGGEETIHTNARVVAATNADLYSASTEGSFRKDLYYRLNVFPIHIPPLCERIEDIPQLINLFLDRLNREFQKDILSVAPEVIRTLSHYDWPGNVRELENLMERAYILEETSVLTASGFPQELFEKGSQASHIAVHTQMPLSEARRMALDDFERRYLNDLLNRNNGKINSSAAEAGITTRQLHKLMSHHGIRKEVFKNRV